MLCEDKNRFQAVENEGNVTTVPCNDRESHKQDVDFSRGHILRQAQHLYPGEPWTLLPLGFAFSSVSEWGVRRAQEQDTLFPTSGLETQLLTS